MWEWEEGGSKPRTCLTAATAKSVRTSFSPSPICIAIEACIQPRECFAKRQERRGYTSIRRTHLLVSELAEMLKNVAPDWFAIALPINVLPVPGGPNSRRPTRTRTRLI